MCIRVVKQALALREYPEYSLVHMQTCVANPECQPVPVMLSFYGAPNQLIQKIREHSDADIVHIHNEPDWMAHCVREVLPDVPIVYDVHDLASQQDTCPNREDRIKTEKEAISYADAYVFVSEGYERWARKYHNIPDSKPSIVLHSCCNRDIVLTMAQAQLPRIRGIAYEGAISAEINTPWGPMRDPSSQHRDLTYLVGFCEKHNIPIALYGVDDAYAKSYMNLGAMVFGRYPYINMLHNLSRYDWCFVGAPEETKTLEHAMPNKLFESIAAGTPVICCNAPEAGQWAEDNGVGINIRSIHEIPEIYMKHKELRPNVEAKRFDFVMEEEIKKLVELYGKVKP